MSRIALAVFVSVIASSCCVSFVSAAGDGTAQINNVLSALPKLGNYNTFVSSMMKTGVDKLIAQYMTKNATQAITLIAFDDNAYRTLAPMYRHVLSLKVKYLAEVMSYNVIWGTYSYAQLKKLKARSKFHNAYYTIYGGGPNGAVLTLVNPSHVSVGSPGTDGVVITKSDLYHQGRVTVHGVSQVMLPSFLSP